MASYYDKNTKTWYCKFYYADWTGRRRQKMKRGFSTKKESAAWERMFLETQQGTPDMTFQVLYHLYIEDMKKRLKASTLTGRKYRIERRILPYFKDKPINQIIPADIRQWQNTILQSDLSESYQRALNDLLSILFNYGVKYYNLPTSPCKAADPIGKAHTKQVNFWTQEEFRSFIQYVKKPDCKTAFIILYYTGLRCGELLALTNADIDLTNAVLSVSKTYRRDGGKDIITSPKTANSVRTVTLPPFVVDSLREYLKTIYNLTDDTRIFPFTYRRLDTSMKNACVKSGVKKIRLHDVRHSHVSLLIEMGFSSFLIAERIGDTVDMVNNIYGHLYPNRHREVADTLQQIVSK